MKSSVDVLGVLAHELVENILKDGTNLNEAVEHVILVMLLRPLVRLVAKRKFLKRKLGFLLPLGAHCFAVLPWVNRCPELGKSDVASVDNESQVSAATFLVEQEVLLSSDAQPVE
jgi:hypothetical protein